MALYLSNHSLGSGIQLKKQQVFSGLSRHSTHFQFHQHFFQNLLLQDGHVLLKQVTKSKFDVVHVERIEPILFASRLWMEQRGRHIFQWARVRLDKPIIIIDIDLHFAISDCKI